MLVVFGTGVAYYFSRLFTGKYLHIQHVFSREKSPYICVMHLCWEAKNSTYMLFGRSKKEHIYVSGRGNSLSICQNQHMTLQSLSPKNDFSVTLVYAQRQCLCSSINGFDCHAMPSFYLLVKRPFIVFLHHLFNMLHGNMKEKSYR